MLEFRFSPSCVLMTVVAAAFSLHSARGDAFVATSISFCDEAQGGCAIESGGAASCIMTSAFVNLPPEAPEIDDFSVCASITPGNLGVAFFYSLASDTFSNTVVDVHEAVADEIVVRGPQGQGHVIYTVDTFRSVPPDAPTWQFEPQDQWEWSHNGAAIPLYPIDLSVWSYFESAPIPIPFGVPFALAGNLSLQRKLGDHLGTGAPSAPSIEDVAVRIYPSVYDANGNLLTNGYTISSLGGFAIRTRWGVVNDFDADNGSDLATYAPRSGQWLVRPSGEMDAPALPRQWGWGRCVPLAADYDGDARTDFAVYWPSSGVWYVQSASSRRPHTVAQFGMTGALPVPADYDGDAMADLAVYQPSTGTWYIRASRTGRLTIFQWGWPRAVPVPGDYDGDGRVDVAVYNPRTSTWYVRQSHDGKIMESRPIHWGVPGSIPVQADYNGDGLCDPATYHAADGKWSIRYYSFDTDDDTPIYWGWGGAIPVPGDYDNDGALDVAVYSRQNSLWYILGSSSHEILEGAPIAWGEPGSVPATLSYPIWKAYHLVR